MATDYKIKLGFTNTDGSVKRSQTINDARNTVDKGDVESFAERSAVIYTDTTVLASAELVQTTTTDLLID